MKYMKGNIRKMPLNSTSLALYAVIEEVHSLTGAGPTYSEMMAMTGIKSKAAVQYHLERLEDFAYITREPRIDRGIVPIHYPRVYYVRRESDESVV